MKKTICCIGSSGFIGKHIYRDIRSTGLYEIYRFSSKDNKFIDKCNITKFDYLIFSAGIHNESEKDSKNVYHESKKIFKKTKKLFLNSNSIIFISSFKTSFNTNEKIVKSTNIYNFYNYDNYYGKSKIIFEKVFKKFCSYYKKRYTIVCPSHVIGPEDDKFSANGKFFYEIMKKKIIFFPECNISIVDVRNLSKIITNLIVKEKFNNKKIIVNDKSLRLKEYIKLIKFNQKYFLLIKIYFPLIKIFFWVNHLLLMLNLTKKNILSNSRIKYIELNPITEVNDEYKEISFGKTIEDTKEYFSRL